ncbi:otoancorin [Melanotaenia boesemani]|uniref:otoancorin n=1 Tax=Melanotaenia boesemani TaxID=1250792 RepID=UPI001C04CBD0|nr:otoancorin [Melanotaenia boesemani]
MAPNGGTYFFILIVACTALAKPLDVMPADKTAFRDIAKKLMMKCHHKGYPVPKMPLKSVLSNSVLPTDNRTADQANSFLSTFLDVLNSVTVGTNRDTVSQLPMEASDEMMWNCSNLPATIKMMGNSSEPSACYMKAFVAPMSWAALTTQGEGDINSSDYDTLVWAAKPVLQDIPSARMNLPPIAGGGNIEKMMEMLQEVYEPMTDDQRTQVLNWAKEQITQNHFNCTMKPPSDAKSMLIDRCKPSLKWLDLDALTMMGPYLSHLAPEDVDSSPKEKLCEFFHSAQFNSNITRANKMSPSLGKKFLQRIQECFSGKEFPEHVDKLGPLACYYDAPDLTPDLSKKLLSQLDVCDNPTMPKLKKRLVKSMMSNSSSTQTLHDLGTSINLLSPEQLSAIPADNLKDVLRSLGDNVTWTRSQLCILVKKQLSDKKCNEVSGEELMALQSTAAGLPSCVLKNIKSQDILTDREALKNISKQMSKGQLNAMLQGLRGKVNLSELVQKLPAPLLQRVSLASLAKANITSLEQVENQTWSRSQALYLAKKMHDLKQLQYRRLHSVLQGLTCNMIDKVADNNTLDMVQAVTETPQWLSKVQAGCAARKLFITLEQKRANYFKTITEQELDRIPTPLLLYLPPLKVKGLPDSVCSVLLDKMETANLSSLPLRAPSRPALTQRALLCLTNGKDLSGLTTADALKLGPFLCEMAPSQLRLMTADVMKFSLQIMASCQHIPQHHRADLIQLVSQTFGNPSDWPSQTMESLGPLVLLDDNATSALPNKPWMKDVLAFLRSRLTNTSDALKKKIFDLTIATVSNTARKKRAAQSDNKGTSNGNESGVNATEPTEALIEELGMENIYWTPAQLHMMSNSTFLATVEILGRIPGYSAEQLDVLRKKAIETFGPVPQMTESVVMQLGCITQGFSNADLEKLPLSLDTLEEVAHCGWKHSQMESVWKGVVKYNNLTAQQLGAADMVTLNQFICGLSSNEISKLSVDAFKDAVGSMDGIQCPFKVMQDFKNRAVSAFGNPKTWSEAQVSDLDTIIAGLNATEMVSLDPSVFPFLSQCCVAQIPPDNFAKLSVAQLEALGPDNAEMVTSKQRAVLKENQLAALEKASIGSPYEPRNSTVPQSGAPQLSVEGIGAVMKPFLFLLMGFLLL